MKTKAVAALSALVVALTSATAFADPPRRGRGHDNHHRAYQKHYPQKHYRHKHHGPKQFYRRSGVVYHVYSPPRTVVYRDFRPIYPVAAPMPVTGSVTHVTCSDGGGTLLGTLLGGTAGGVVGNQFGKGSGRTAATIGGAIIGTLIGYDMSRTDRHCANQVFEYAPSGQPVAWDGYQLMPQPAYEMNGRYCREYQANVVVGGRQQQGYGTACRQPDGSWEIVS